MATHPLRNALFSLLALPTLLLAQKAQEDAPKGNNPITGDTWLISLWEKVRDGAKAAWNWLSTHVHGMLVEDLQLPQANLTLLAIALLVLSLMLASGAWAASIALMRRHKGLPFFFLGFFTFFLGPARLLYGLEIKGEKEQKERFAQAAAQRRAEEAERARKEAEQARERGQESPAVSQEGVVWDQAYFASIQRKEDGTPAGPWHVAYNGVTVTVTEILEPLPECVQVKMVNAEGAPLVGRIPYARLEAWDPLPQEGEPAAPGEPA